MGLCLKNSIIIWNYQKSDEIKDVRVEERLFGKKIRTNGRGEEEDWVMGDVYDQNTWFISEKTSK